MSKNSKKTILALLEAVEPTDAAINELAQELVTALSALCLAADDPQGAARRLGDDLQNRAGIKRKRKKTANMRFCHLVGRLH